MITKSEKRAIALMSAAFVGLSGMSFHVVDVRAEEGAAPAAQQVSAGVHNETVVQNGGETVRYSFVPEETGVYRFTSFGEGDTYGSLYNEQGELLCSANDGGEGVNFGFDAELQAGTAYYAEIGYFLDTDTGVIDWIVEESDDGKAEETTDGEATPDTETTVGPSEQAGAETEGQENALLTEQQEKGQENSQDNGQKQQDKEADEKGQTNSQEDFEYKVLDDQTIEIVKYTGSAEQAEIPGTIEGKSVASIGEKAFEGKEKLTAVTIPNTVTQLQYYSFASCKDLKTVVFAEGSQLQSIGGGAFSKSGLTKIEMPDSVREIETRAFEGCGNLTEVQFGNNLVSIENLAFCDTAITKAILPDSLTKLGRAAFRGCEQLSEVRLGSGLQGIEGGTFSGCEALKQIEFPENITYIDGWAFSQTGLESVVIPDNVTSIGDRVFSNCENLKSAEIGNGLAYISKGAFVGAGLTEVKIGNKVQVIDDYAFGGNRELKSVAFPNSVTRIEYCSFRGCTSLAEIELPDSVEALGGKTFHETAWYNNQQDGVVYAGKVLYTYKGDMPKGTVVEVQEGTKGIGAYAFDTQENLQEIQIPDSVTNIGEFAFFDCSSMKSVTIPYSVREIGKYAIGYVKATSEDGDIHTKKEGIETSGYHKKVEGFTICAEAGTAAERYAKENGFEFKEIEPDYIQGDVNEDGRVDVADLRLVIRYVCGTGQLTNRQQWIADMDKSGSIERSDMIKMLKIICDKI